MLEIFKELQGVINGPEAEITQQWYFGKYFSGSIGVVIDADSYVMTFQKGVMTDVYQGTALEGTDFGLSGSREKWDDFFRRGIFGYATAPSYQNPLGLTVTGSILRFRQNYNICAHVLKQLAQLCRERGLV